MMGLYEEAKTRVSVDSVLSLECEVNMWMHQRSVLSPFVFVVVVDVVTVLAREGALSELMYAGDFVLMSETTEGLRNSFLKWNEAFENKDLKANLGKSMVMFRGGITKDGFSETKVVPCGFCSLRA